MAIGNDGQKKISTSQASRDGRNSCGLRFAKVRHGKHPCYERPPHGERRRAVVPVDDYSVFDETLIKSMIEQSGFSREQFYGATKSTAKKI